VATTTVFTMTSGTGSAEWRALSRFNTLLSVNIPHADGEARDTLLARAAAGLGPAPHRAPAAPTRTSRAAAAVLDLLESQSGPVTVAELAERAGQHPNTIREHLDTLVTVGLAERERADAEGRGRPSWLYAAVSRPPASPEYAGLATALAMQIARTSDNAREEALEAGVTWGAQLAERQPAPSTAAAARQSVVDLLGDLGFDPEADLRREHVRLRQCPLLEAAMEQPDVVCSVHLGLVRGALDTWHTSTQQTSLVPFAEPGACVLHLTGATRRSA
jgi:predicted ArsR family transcriptional regulator